MRTATQIGKIALGIKGNGAIGQIFDQVELVLIAFLSKIIDRISFAHRFTDIFLTVFCQLNDLIFYLFEIIR